MTPCRADDIQIGTADHAVAVCVPAAEFARDNGGAPVSTNNVQVAATDEPVTVEIARQRFLSGEEGADFI